MGSVKHPSNPASYRPLDDVEGFKAAFREIYNDIQGQTAFPPVADEELKAAIMARLLDLARNGTLPEDFKSKVLSSLALAEN
jgi:hypothetical protein